MREYPDDRLLQGALKNGDEQTCLKILQDTRRAFDVGVAIVMPAFASVHPKAAESLVIGRKILDERFGFCHVQIQSGSLLPDARELLATVSVAARTKFTFWIDADMDVPAPAWHQLADVANKLYHDPEKDDHAPTPSLEELKHATFWALGIAYPSRGPVPDLAAAIEQPPTPQQLEIGDCIDVAGIGLGCAVIPTACMALTSSPLFERKYLAGPGRFIGEDLALCQKLRAEHDASILLDLSTAGVAHLCEERRDMAWYVTRRRINDEATLTRKIRDGKGIDGDVSRRIVEGEYVERHEFDAEQERMRTDGGEG